MLVFLGLSCRFGTLSPRLCRTVCVPACCRTCPFGLVHLFLRQGRLRFRSAVPGASPPVPGSERDPYGFLSVPLGRGLLRGRLGAFRPLPASLRGFAPSLLSAFSVRLCAPLAAQSHVHFCRQWLLPWRPNFSCARPHKPLGLLPQRPPFLVQGAHATEAVRPGASAHEPASCGAEGFPSWHVQLGESPPTPQRPEDFPLRSECAYISHRFDVTEPTADPHGCLLEGRFARRTFITGFAAAAGAGRWPVPIIRSDQSRGRSRQHSPGTCGR